MVVRLTAAGVAARMEMDLETLDDVKTAVYEACYAMTMQKFIPEQLTICFAPGEPFAVRPAPRRLAGDRGKVPDLKLCYAVLTTMIPHVKVDMDERKIRCIELHR